MAACETEKNMKNTVKNKKGAAMLIALVIMLVVIALSLSLLLASYSLLYTSTRQQRMEQSKELAKSLSEEIQQEIAGSGIAQANAGAQSLSEIQEKDYPLWYYLRCNVWQNSWPYYNPGERGHTSSKAYRTFEVDMGEKADKMEVTLYWEADFTQEYSSDKNGTPLYVIVSCQVGDQKSTITSKYQLDVKQYVQGSSESTGSGTAGSGGSEDGGSGSGDSEENGSGTEGQKNGYQVITSTYNPAGNSVDTKDLWTWVLEERM